VGYNPNSTRHVRRPSVAAATKLKISSSLLLRFQFDEIDRRLLFLLSPQVMVALHSD